MLKIENESGYEALGAIIFGHIFVALAFFLARHFKQNRLFRGLNILSIMLFTALIGLMGWYDIVAENVSFVLMLMFMIYGIVNGMRSVENPNVQLAPTVFWYARIFMRERNNKQSTPQHTRHTVENHVIHTHRVIVEHRVIHVRNDGTREVSVVFKNGDRQLVDVPANVSRVENYIKQLPKG